MRIHDFVFDEASACISMEYVDGEMLANLRADKEQKVFESNELAAWTAQLCDALDYAHTHARIIHRDLKPANLMVNQKGDLKVSDFGIARSLGDSMSKLTMASGCRPGALTPAMRSTGARGAAQNSPTGVSDPGYKRSTTNRRLNFLEIRLVREGLFR